MMSWDQGGLRHACLIAATALLIGCGGDDAEPADVEVRWDANREQAVNSAGGGYRVLYSQDADFQPGDSGVQSVDVPFDADTGTTPTRVTIEQLDPGTWYFRVRAFSALSPPDGTGTSMSAPSAPSSVTVGDFSPSGQTLDGDGSAPPSDDGILSNQRSS